MNQRYESRKEYSLMDVLQYNLRKWWLAAVFAAVFAVIVGGYKAKTLMPYIDARQGGVCAGRRADQDRDG